ncbi:MAG: prolipoprotein diacylglyceryl transferase [Gloeobacterales cyanobacterium]
MEFFPIHLGFQSPGPVIFQAGPLTIRWYSVMIISGIILGTLLAQRLAKQRDEDPEKIADLAVWLVAGAIPFARLYYVLFEWERYAQGPWWKVFAIWEGGIAIHGGIIGGMIAGYLFAKKTKINFWKLTDICAPALALGQAIGRWGNFFNSEAFGVPTDLPWKLYIPPESRPTAFIANNYFHPTFLYESLWNLMVMGILLWLFKKFPNWGQGTITATYAVLYGIGRFWIEGLRTDSLYFGSLRMAQVVSLLFIALGLFGWWWFNRQPGKASESL